MLSFSRYDITINQGATFELPVQYKDASNQPVNMSGYTVASALWNRTSTEKLADFNVTWVVQASGAFSLRLSDATTSGIAEQGYYDVLVTQPNGDKFYLLEGAAFLNPGLSFRG